MKQTFSDSPAAHAAGHEHARPNMTEGTLEGVIARMGAQGDGVLEAHKGAQADGQAAEPHGALYLPLTLPGETVRVTLKKGNVEVFERLSDSPDRVSPPCPLYGQCGGCQLQHWDTQAQLDWKRQKVIDLLLRAGVDAASLPEIAPTRAAFGHGRRRASLHLRNKPEEGVRLGFKARGRHEVIDMTACTVLHPRLFAAVPNLKALAVPLLGKKPTPTSGCDLMVTLTDDGLDVDIRGLEKALTALTPARRTELASLAAQLGLARLSLAGVVVAQLRPPSLLMGKARVMLPPGPFLQANTEAEEVLTRLACEAVTGALRVADLFSGLGPFALRLAEQSAVGAYDSERPALDALRKAADATKGLKRIDTTHRDLFRQPLSAMELRPFDAVVLDPPRAGAEAQCKVLASAEVAKLKGLTRLAYVSCAPDAFARDAMILLAGGWRLTHVTPVDQFRWSSHIELVARLER